MSQGARCPEHLCTAAARRPVEAVRALLSVGPGRGHHRVGRETQGDPQHRRRPDQGDPLACRPGRLGSDRHPEGCCADEGHPEPRTGARARRPAPPARRSVRPSGFVCLRHARSIAPPAGVVHTAAAAGRRWGGSAQVVPGGSPPRASSPRVRASAFCTSRQRSADSRSSAAIALSGRPSAECR